MGFTSSAEASSFLAGIKPTCSSLKLTNTLYYTPFLVLESNNGIVEQNVIADDLTCALFFVFFL